MDTKTIRAKDVRINDGGMMRCCTHTLANWLEGWEENDRIIEVNTTVKCLYAPDDANHTWILDSTGTFRWFRPEAQA